jgi:hypothetical protein
MERCQCKSQHRKLMRENCGVRAAHSARDGARPQPLTLAFWPLPVPLRYLVDAGPNEARKRMRDTMAPLNHKTQISTYPLISHWKFPTVVTD